MYSKEKSYYKKAFFVALIMAAVMFLPFVIIDRGYFTFYGDYNSQQIPFFKHSIEMVHNGTMGWDWSTDLGANFVGSYTYYTLGSPFFWFMCLFPSSVSHYLMAPLLCVKIALFSFFGFIYIRRFVTKPQTALIGGLLYAFSSFNIYNIFFQFQDAIIWFPLLLIGLEEAVINKRRGVFALTIAINCLANYFFFIGECVFLAIYFSCRILMDRRFRVGLSDLFFLMFECIAGVMIAGVLFFPSIYQVLDVPRSTSTLSGWDFIFFSNKQRYGLLIESMFFPPEIPARNNMFTEANAKWSSVALYLPLFSMAGVIAFLRGAKGHWARSVLTVCLIMAFIPAFNAMFTMLNDNYYTRWFYMPELICCLATAYALEHEECDIEYGRKACFWGVFITSLFVLLTPFVVTKTVDGVKTSSLVPRFLINRDDLDFFKKAGVDGRIYIQIVIALLFLIALFILLKQRKKLRFEKYMKRITGAVIVCSLILSWYFLGLGRYLGGDIEYYDSALNARFDIDDDEFYRIEGVNETNNFNMFSESSSLKSFTSIIPGSTFELYETLGINRSVNSDPDYSQYAFRALTRVKYIMLRKNTSEAARVSWIHQLEIYDYIDTQGEFDIYSTDLALPMGFAYDTYFPIGRVKGTDKADNLMVRSVFLTDEQIEKYGDILEEDDSRYNISYVQFKVDAKEKIENGVLDFEVTKSGFTSKTNYGSDKLVCFTVPYCTGWSCKINGEKAEVDKINGGLIGIRVPAGECDIEFTYETPGLRYGLIATILGIALLAIYLLIIYFVMKERPVRYAHLFDCEQTEGISAHMAYIKGISKTEAGKKDKTDKDE
ncbi:MAG: YfhO family protein [Oscillospiraceae bacterium]|nr:YfhO family protein [Oscillospiraceae bacterium]